MTAWRQHFEWELTESDWATVLGRWLPRFAPGASGAALHGLIRVGHAVRGLTALETAPRRREFAAALACWAASYAELPTRREVVETTLSPHEALALVRPVPWSQRRNTGAITGALKVLDDQAAFATAIDLPAVEGDLRAVTEAFAVLFAKVFLANVRTPLEAIVFTHGVTGFVAAEALLPYLGHEVGADLIRYVWQAAAGLYATYGGHLPPESVASPDGRAAVDLIDAAVAHGDDHVIKLTHACLHLVARRALGLALLLPQLALSLLPPAYAEVIVQ